MISTKNDILSRLDDIIDQVSQLRDLEPETKVKIMLQIEKASTTLRKTKVNI